jgi:hypothetical protein
MERLFEPEMHQTLLGLGKKLAGSLLLGSERLASLNEPKPAREPG